MRGEPPDPAAPGRPTGSAPRRLPVVGPEGETSGEPDAPAPMPVDPGRPTVLVADLAGRRDVEGRQADALLAALTAAGVSVVRSADPAALGTAPGAPLAADDGPPTALLAEGDQAAAGLLRIDLCILTGLDTPPTSWRRSLRRLRPAADLCLGDARPGVAEGLAAAYPWRSASPRPISGP